MIKVIQIDGKDVAFKANAATPMRYKMQTGNDYFADIMRLKSLSVLLKDDEEGEQKEIPADALAGLDFSFLYNLLWTMAKTADKDTPDLLTWLDGFDEFPLLEILMELMELITNNLQQSAKKK